jgi:hypothetical protein
MTSWPGLTRLSSCFARQNSVVDARRKAGRDDALPRDHVSDLVVAWLKAAKAAGASS